MGAKRGWKGKSKANRDGRKEGVVYGVMGWLGGWLFYFLVVGDFDAR